MNNAPRFKVQVACDVGWWDLKSTEDDGATYKTDLYDTREAAQAEADEYCMFSGDGTRVVTENEPEQWSPYVD